MPMFPKYLDWAPFGRLEGEGRSSCWEGELNLGAWGESVWLRIHGSPAGPSAGQHQALSMLVAKSAALKAQAAVAIIDFLRECEAGVGMRLLPPEPFKPDALWDLVEPGFSEMGDTENDCAIYLGFGLPWLRQRNHEASAYLYYLDGALIEVSSGI